MTSKKVVKGWAIVDELGDVQTGGSVYEIYWSEVEAEKNVGRTFRIVPCEITCDLLYRPKSKVICRRCGCVIASLDDEHNCSYEVPDGE